MNIADDLVSAFNDGYAKGKADAEAYLLHCGDTDEPQTNADRIRAMTDEELAEHIAKCVEAAFFRANVLGIKPNNKDDWLDWLREEVTRNDS